MMRKLAMAMVVSGAFGSSFANALGLGEFKLNSALNEPLDAEVRLLNVGDLSENEILPNLASHADFERAGVERIFFLTGIKFDVEIDKQGGAVIHLTTDQIVREPFLNFLLELHWPNGRLLREYTALIDPPLFSESAPAPAMRALATSRIAAARTEAPVQQAPATGSSDPAASRGDGTVRVKKNDTLWGIAKTHRPDRSVTIRQTMVSIQQENPHAFINNNINLLKSGEILRIPDAADIRRISSEQADQETQRQNAAWSQNRTLDASKQEGRAEAEAQASQEGSGMLKLVASGSDNPADPTNEGAAGGPSSGSANAAQGSAIEAGDGSGAGSAPANAAQLEKELAELQRLVSLKQNQLAALQQALSEQQENAQAASVSDSAAEPGPLADEATGETHQGAGAADMPAAEGEQAIGTAASQAPSTELAEDATAQTGSEQAPAAAETEAVTAAPASANTRAQTAVQNAAAADARETRPRQGIMDILTGNPLYIGAIIVLLLGALILVGLVSRRRNQAAQYPEDLQEALDEPDHAITLPGDKPEAVGGIASAAPIADEASTETSEPVAATVNAQPAAAEKLLEEADVYIAYGRYERAIELLQPAVNEAPDNTALRLKLAEVFLHSDQPARFSQQEADLQALGDVQALDKLEALKRKYAKPDAAETLAEQALADFSETEMPDSADQTLPEEALVQAQAPVEPEVDELEFELPDLDEAQKAADEASEPAEQAHDNLVEFNLEDFEPVEPGATEEEEDFLDVEAVEGNKDFTGFDLDLEETPEESAEADTEGLDFMGDTDEAATKLELARAYIDMADTEAAQDILSEVVTEGSEAQQQEARKLLEELAS